MIKKAKLKISSRLLKKRNRKSPFSISKQCRFCSGGNSKICADYKNVDLLRSFMTERGKILPSRISGNCAKHQRNLALQIKRARIMALMPFSAVHI